MSARGLGPVVAAELSTRAWLPLAASVVAGLTAVSLVAARSDGGPVLLTLRGVGLAFRELVSAHGEHHAVVLSTHQTEDVAALCNRVVVIDGGRIRFDGTTAEPTSIASGRVWAAPERDMRASRVWRTGEGVWRHIGDPPAGATSVPPTIEDGYLLLLEAPQLEEVAA